MWDLLQDQSLVPLSALIGLCSSLISSFLNYGITFWGLTHNSYLNCLFLLQKKILRSISFQPFSAPSAPIFLSLRILKVEDLLHFNILTFVYKSISKLSPTYSTSNSSVHRFGTRQATRGDLNPLKLWNALPLFIRVASSV